MKRSKVLIIVMVFGFLFVSNTYTYGQEFYIGAKMGLSLQDANFPGLTIEYKPESSTVFGFQIGMKIENFMVEASYYQADHLLNEEETPPPEFDFERFKLNYFGLNIKYFLQIPVVQPFLTAGYGSYKIDLVGFDKDRSGGFNVGLGASVQVTKYISFSVEGKYHRVSFELVQEKMNVNDFVWNVSFNFHF